MACGEGEHYGEDREWNVWGKQWWTEDVVVIRAKKSGKRQVSGNGGGLVQTDVGIGYTKNTRY